MVGPPHRLFFFWCYCWWSDFKWEYVIAKSFSVLFSGKFLNVYFIISPLAIYQQQQISFIIVVWKSRLFLYFSIKSSSGSFNRRGKFDELVSYDSCSECHMIVLIAVKVYYYLFSEGWGNLVFLGLRNYLFTRTTEMLKEELANMLFTLLPVQGSFYTVLNRCTRS